MKKLTLSLCAVVALVSAAHAGTESYSGKEMKQTVEQPAPCPEWYADNEWNISIWGTYVFTGNEWREDRYLGVDHAWGGGIDAKYFFRRYFGVGVEGYGLSVNNNRSNDGIEFDDDDDEDRDFAGAVLGTFTLRYPIPCSRFAPYTWVGGGAIFGGGDADAVLFDDDDDDGLFDDDDDSDARGMLQAGVGFEVRFTPRIGMINDFSWNVVKDRDNNFGMVRSGINFAF